MSDNPTLLRLNLIIALLSGLLVLELISILPPDVVFPLAVITLPLLFPVAVIAVVRLAVGATT